MRRSPRFGRLSSAEGSRAWLGSTRGGVGVGVDHPAVLGEITRSAVLEPDGGDGYARRVQVMDTDAA
jgi:hypothetical protein